ncbi:hypothetical protein BH11PSE7_BH11PSE7_34920 [soil metagenome]
MFVTALNTIVKSPGVDVAWSMPAVLACMPGADTQEWKPLIKQIGFTAKS